MVRRRPYPCAFASIEAALLAALLAGVIAGVLARCGRRLVRIEVEGQSMAPGLHPGDRLLAVRGLTPRPDDVVTAEDPRHPGRVIIKRIVVRYADGSVELAGDNAEASTDSRSFGPVPAALIGARVVWRYRPAHRRGRFPQHHGQGPGRENPPAGGRVG